MDTYDLENPFNHLGQMAKDIIHKRHDVALKQQSHIVTTSNTKKNHPLT